MSYLSDVRVSTTIDGYESIKKYCDSNPIKFQLIGTNIVPEIEEIDEKSDSVVFGWDWIEWGYKINQEPLKESLKELDKKGIPWEFLRVGEDLNDIERLIGENGLPPNGLYLKICNAANIDEKSQKYRKSLKETIDFLQINKGYFEFEDNWKERINLLNELLMELS